MKQLNKLTKWDEFRKKREITINNYLNARRIYFVAKAYATNIFFFCNLKIFFDYFREKVARIRSYQGLMKVIKKKIGNIKIYFSRKGSDLVIRKFSIVRNSFLYIGGSNLVA